MAIKFYNNSSETINLPDFINEVSQRIEFGNEDSLLQCVDLLFKLSNNKTFFVDYLNELIIDKKNQSKNPYSEQSFLICDCPSFYVRMTYWPILSNNEKVRASQNDLFSYGFVHDHNFSLLTANYYGDGYITKLWEYDHNSIIGYVNEDVNIKFLEETTLSPGKALYYRPSKDIHSQYAPLEEDSLAINIILKSYKQFEHKQYAFDIENKKIKQVIKGSSASKYSMINLTSFFHNDKTIELLENLYINPNNVIEARQEALLNLYKITNDINYYKSGTRSESDKIIAFSKMKLDDFN